MSKIAHINFKLSESEMTKLRVICGGENISKTIRKLINEGAEVVKNDTDVFNKLISRIESADTSKITEGMKSIELKVGKLENSVNTLEKSIDALGRWLTENFEK